MTPGKSRRHRGTSVVAVAAVAGLFVTAAGSASGATTPSEPAGSSATADADAEGPATGTPVTLVVIEDASGPASSCFGHTTAVVEAWAAHWNEHGGVGGHPVEIVVNDTKGDAATATSMTEEVIDDDSVAGVVMCDESTNAVIAPLLSAAKLPIIGGHGYAYNVWAPETGLPYVYGVTTTFPDNSIVSAVTDAVAVGATKWIAALCGEYPSCADAAPLYNEALNAAGVENLGTIQALASAPDFTALCLEVINRGADFLSMQHAGFVAVRIAQDCRTQGYEGWIGIGHATAQVDVIADLDHVTGPLNSFPWFVDAPPVNTYREIMEEQSVETAAWSNVVGTSAYATMELFRTALEATPADGDITREAVIAAYANVADETLDGLLPNPVTFTDGGTPAAIPCHWMYVKEGGEITGDFTPTCPTD